MDNRIRKIVALALAVILALATGSAALSEEKKTVRIMVWGSTETPQRMFDKLNMHVMRFGNLRLISAHDAHRSQCRTADSGILLEYKNILRAIVIRGYRRAYTGNTGTNNQQIHLGIPRIGIDRLFCQHHIRRCRQQK